MKENDVWSRKFVVLIMLTVIINISASVIIPTMPIILKDNFSQSFVTLVFVALLLSRFITANFVGRLLTKISPSKLLSFGFVLQSLTMFLFTYAHTETHFIALRVIEGVFEGIVMVVLQFVVSNIASESNRGRVMGIFTSSFGIGFILGPVIGSILIRNMGIEGVFIGTSAIMLVGVVIVALTYSSLNVKKDCTTKVDVIDHGNQPSFRSEFIRYLPYYAGSIIQRGLFVSFGVLLPMYLFDIYQIPAYEIGYYFTGSALFTTILMPFTGRLGDTQYKSVFAGLSLLVMGFSIALLAVAPNESWFMALYIIETIAFSVMVPTTMSIFFGKIEKNCHRASIIGSSTSARDLFAIVIITLVVPTYEINASLPWIILGAFVLLSSFAYIREALKTFANDAPDDLDISSKGVGK